MKNKKINTTKMNERTKEAINYSIMYLGIIAFLTSIIYNICTSGLGL